MSAEIKNQENDVMLAAEIADKLAEYRELEKELHRIHNKQRGNLFKFAAITAAILGLGYLSNNPEVQNQIRAKIAEIGAQATGQVYQAAGQPLIDKAVWQHNQIDAFFGNPDIPLGDKLQMLPAGVLGKLQAGTYALGGLASAKVAGGVPDATMRSSIALLDINSQLGQYAGVAAGTAGAIGAIKHLASTVPEGRIIARLAEIEQEIAAIKDRVAERQRIQESLKLDQPSNVSYVDFTPAQPTATDTAGVAA